MTSAPAEMSADLNEGEVKTRIPDMSPELDAALRRWHDQANVILRTLRAPCFLLHAIREDDTPPSDDRIDTALLTTEQCIAMIEKLEDELDLAAHGHALVAERPVDGDGEPAGGGAIAPP